MGNRRIYSITKIVILIRIQRSIINESEVRVFGVMNLNIFMHNLSNFEMIVSEDSLLGRNLNLKKNKKKQKNKN